MSKEQSNNETSATQKQAMSKEDRSSLVLGIVAVLIVVGIFCLLLAAITNGKRIQGEFGTCRRRRSATQRYGANACV